MAEGMQQTATVEALLARAIEHANAGRHDEASRLCRTAQDAYPPHPAVLQLLAVLALHSGRLESARGHAAASLDLRPDHVPTLVTAGDASMADGFDLEASRYFMRASTLDPTRRGLGLKLGIAQHRSGDSAAACATLERLVAVDPLSRDGWFQLSLVRQDRRDFEGAAAALRHVIALAPDRVEAEVNLGIVLQEAGRMAEAMQAYGRACRARPEQFGRIAHALAAASAAGEVWLDLEALRDALTAGPERLNAQTACSGGSADTPPERP